MKNKIEKKREKAVLKVLRLGRLINSTKEVKLIKIKEDSFLLREIESSPISWDIVPHDIPDFDFKILILGDFRNLKHGDLEFGSGENLPTVKQLIKELEKGS